MENHQSHRIFIYLKTKALEKVKDSNVISDMNNNCVLGIRVSFNVYTIRQSRPPPTDNRLVWGEVKLLSTHIVCRVMLYSCIAHRWLGLALRN